MYNYIYNYIYNFPHEAGFILHSSSVYGAKGPILLFHVSSKIYPSIYPNVCSSFY